MNTSRTAVLVVLAGLAQSATAQCPPAPPQGVAASQGAYCGNVYIQWQEVSGANIYNIYRNTTNNYQTSGWIGSTLFGATHFTDITAFVNTNYYYWVTAKRDFCIPGHGTSAPSDFAQGWRDQDPLAPIDVQASDGTVCGGVLVTWNQPVPEYAGLAATHTIYRNTTNLYFNSVSVGTTGPGSGYFLDTSAGVGTTYYYWVRAENQCGTAASSSDSGFGSSLPAPSNDSCATAMMVGPGTYVGSTSCATRDASATCEVLGSASRDVWYAFSPPLNGTLHVDTCGASGSFNTVLSIRSGCPGTELACDNDGCGTQSSLDLAVSQGGVYRIRVGGRSTLDMGVYQLHVGFTPAASPCYANCDGSTVTPVLTGNDFVCFLNAFAAGQSYANCDGSSGTPVLTGNDFVCFLNRFAAGCS